MKLACLMQHRRKYQAKIVMKIQFYSWKHKFQDIWKSEFPWLINDSSSDVMYCDVYRKTGPDIAGKTEFVTEKKSLKVKVLLFLIKLKVWNMKNVSIWFQQKPIPQISIFCLIQGINNYVQINTYLSCIVRIGIFINLASNILLLASKKCFLTSQG